MKNPYADRHNPYQAAARAEQDGVTDPQATPEASTFFATDAEPVPANLAELCREHICPTCPVKAEAEDTRLRSLAEMENFKRRMQREFEERGKYTGEAILADLLPALDSMDLAIRYANSEQDGSLLQGVIMTRKLLLDALKPHGLVTVGEVGEAFDHELHEAVDEESRDDMPPLHVAALMQRGYKLKDRLLRPAKVTVSRTPT